MDLAEFHRWAFGPQPDPSAAARRLAAALVARLAAVMPAPFRVEADGALVSVFEGTAYDSITDVASVLDQTLETATADERAKEVADRVVSIGEHVLSMVQDAIAESTTEPWPRLPSGAMANASSRTDGERVYLWYGPRSDREDDAVLILAPLVLRELAAPDADT